MRPATSELKPHHRPTRLQLVKYQQGQTLLAYCEAGKLGETRALPKVTKGLLTFGDLERGSSLAQLTGFDEVQAHSRPSSKLTGLNSFGELGRALVRPEPSLACCSGKPWAHPTTSSELRQGEAEPQRPVTRLKLACGRSPTVNGRKGKWRK